MESTLTICPPRRRANSRATEPLPDAVGPMMKYAIFLTAELFGRRGDLSRIDPPPGLFAHEYGELVIFVLVLRLGIFAHGSQAAQAELLGHVK